MNLTEIEIHGFKSFKSKFNFKLDKNLIGIVGPNGSGKSNIIDAVRWALGEQSAKNLRGSNMQDIIFSGTENYRANNFAEVSLKFSSNNENTIVTRRLYRNGDSEYLVNNKKSKLKDITDIYLDLGINKESYSIITQGKVENIISSKPQDRRIIIEEAAGVLKYKNKRKETYNKLEKTNENIQRLNDIFLEIESRNNVLANQKEKTEKYFHYKKKYEEKDRVLRVYNIKSLKLKLEDLLEKRNIYYESIDNYGQDLRVLENNLKKVQYNIKNIDKKFSILKNDEIQLVKDQERISYEFQLTEEKIKNREEKIKALEIEENKITKKKKDVIEKIELLRKDLKFLKNNLKDEANKIENLEQDDNDKSIYYFEEKIDFLKNEYFNVITKESQLQNKLELQKKIDDNSKTSLDNIYKKLEVLKEELKEKNKLLLEKNEKLESVGSKLELINKNIYKLKKEENLNKILKEQILNKIVKGKNIYETFKNKLEFIDSQNKNFNLYNQGVIEIIKNKKKISGIHYTVGEILNFNTEYLDALDIILGNSQQNIIVDNPETAKKCIEHLKKQQNGRATFLPLTSISSRNIDKNIVLKLMKKEGFINVASKLVTYDNKYINIVEHLLGNILVVKDLTIGNEVAKEINYRYKIVTLDGQVINSGGSLTGGSLYKNNKSILKTKVEYLELDNNIKKINEKLDYLKLELENVDKKLIFTTKNIEEEIERLEKNNISKKQLELDIDNINLLIKNISININQEEDSILEFSEENDLIEEKKIIEDELLKCGKKLKDISKELEILNIKKEEAKTIEHKYKENIAKKNIEIHSIKQNIKYKQRQIEENDVLLSDFEEEYKNLITEKSMLLNLSPENTHSLAVYNNNFEKIKEKLSNIGEELSKLDIEKESLYLEEESLSEKLKLTNNTLHNINSKVGYLNVEIGKNENKISEAIAYLIENYGVTYESEENTLNNYSIVELSSFNNIIPDLKKKIDELGSINLNAVEEFNEVHERYIFYKKEITDLKNSKDKLENIIFEIDREVSDRFLNTFNSVAIKFDDIYKKIFGGGYAKITLENDKDILNSGINIEVSPPGKKLQKISLLSGGEKSLTAISLLFAILEITKPPFVILDEVEAALDEDNVLKFSQFLKYYSQENIFLVITHRRGTMESMDKLYGVTMKEKGVSYTLQLELEDMLKEKYINE